MPPSSKPIDDKDEVIVVTLPRSDYEIFRDMLERQKSLSWLGKYVRTVLFVFAGGIVALVALGDTIRKGLMSWLGS